MFIFLIEQLYLFVNLIIPILISVAYFTLAERKIIAAIQRRIGPNTIGYLGLLQPLADGLKLITKQIIIPNKSQRFLFLFAPVLSFGLALSAWIVIPFDYNAVLVDIELGIIYLLIISTLGVYGLIIAGWASNSKYAFLGALRSTAQIISFDISIGLILLCIVLCSSSYNLTEIVLAQKNIWYIIPLFPLAIIFFISSLAETNRSPFDLTEAESELVSGYNVEYSGVGFALFFLAEYSNILLISIYISILFLGGWFVPFSVLIPNIVLILVPNTFWLSIKASLIGFLIIWVRASLPRYRYDQLINLGWKTFFPLTLSIFIFLNSIFF